MVDAKLRRLTRTGMVALAIVGLLAAGPAANAGHRHHRDHPHRVVVARGHCSADSVWRLVLAQRGRHVIIVGFSVRTGVPGEVWRVKLAHGDHLFFVDLLTTGDDGVLGVRRPTRNRDGRDVYRARARNLVTDETCVARLIV
jgi:hypothetical protein